MQGTFLAHVSRSVMSDCLRGFQQSSPLLPEEQGQVAKERPCAGADMIYGQAWLVVALGQGGASRAAGQWLSCPCRASKYR